MSLITADRFKIKTIYTVFVHAHGLSTKDETRGWTSSGQPSGPPWKSRSTSCVYTVFCKHTTHSTKKRCELPFGGKIPCSGKC